MSKLTNAQIAALLNTTLPRLTDALQELQMTRKTTTARGRGQDHHDLDGRRDHHHDRSGPDHHPDNGRSDRARLGRDPGRWNLPASRVEPPGDGRDRPLHDAHQDRGGELGGADHYRRSAR
jgi:hypothetical protein